MLWMPNLALFLLKIVDVQVNSSGTKDHSAVNCINSNRKNEGNTG